MKQTQSFTTGPILSPLLKFAIPILGALILQTLYGAVDLMVVGRFADARALSGVSTGSQLIMTVTSLVAGLSIGTTILVGHRIGEGRGEEAGHIIGSSVWLFGILGLALSALIPAFSRPLSVLLDAPEEALTETVAYVAICGGGAIFIVAYNVLGSIFRGMGDSRTPLLAVVIACIANILGDLLFVAAIPMGAAGAALATVLAQALSVLLCVWVIRRRGLPFPFSRACLRPKKELILRVFRLGAPIALQDLLVSISFLVILVVINGLGLVASAGIGVAEKLCGFIMLVPSAFSQSLSAFVAQNIGANRPDRARRALWSGVGVSFAFGCVMAYAAFFHGDLLAALFTSEEAVQAAAWEYLKAYAIDTLLVSFTFCLTGYFNGCGKTTFVMAQGLITSFCVRMPFSYLMSLTEGVTVFKIGLATPASSLLGIALCMTYFFILRKKQKACE